MGTGFPKLVKDPASEICLGTCFFGTFLANLFFTDLAWESLSWSPAWGPCLRTLPGHLFLETSSGKTCFGSLFSGSGSANLCLGTLLRNLAWDPVLGSLLRTYSWNLGIFGDVDLSCSETPTMADRKLTLWEFLCWGKKNLSNT